MTHDEAHAVYDPDLALARAGGRRDLRDRTLIGLLDLLEDPARGGRLLDVARYARDPAGCREAAHRAVGVARQAATPQLEALLHALEEALAASDLTTAAELGRRLPAAVDALSAALGGAGSAHGIDD